MREGGMVEKIAPESLTRKQRLRHQFNEASARVDGLRRLIDMRRADHADCAQLLTLLHEAEAEKNAAHAELAKAGPVKVLSRAHT
jgi:hypothetical protein